MTRTPRSRTSFTREYENPRIVDFVNALLQAAPGVLLLSHRDQSVGIGTLDPNEDSKEIRCCQGAEQFGIVSKIYRRFGGKFKREILAG